MKAKQILWPVLAASLALANACIAMKDIVVDPQAPDHDLFVYDTATDQEVAVVHQCEADTGIREVGELVRGHLELAADNVSDRRFDAMWKEIDAATSAPARDPT